MLVIVLGEVVIYNCNYVLNVLFKEYGILVYEVCFSELFWGWGGLWCMFCLIVCEDF